MSEHRAFAEPRTADRFGPARDDEGLDQALAQWIEVDQRARALVDDALRICWLNPSAASLMSSSNSVLIRNAHIRTRESRYDRQLRELVNSASRQRSTSCVHDAKTGEHLLLTAVRLSAPADNMVGLTMLLANESASFHLADLNSAFGLTQSESRVAYRLMRGRTAEETAHELGVSLETVRTHIKRAYAKLDVSSREAFFHRLTPFILQ
jgi:DNA-binding CsgD family transcriptional regulator